MNKKDKIKLDNEMYINYTCQSMLDKLIRINVPRVLAQKIVYDFEFKSKSIDWDGLKLKYSKPLECPFLYAIYNNMVYEIEDVVDIKTSSKGRDSYYLKLKYLDEVHLFSRKKCFKTYEETIAKRDMLLNKKRSR